MRQSHHSGQHPTSKRAAEHPIAIHQQATRRYRYPLTALHLLVTLTVVTGSARPTTAADWPTRDQVGADRLPEAIAPIEAPFPMPALERPVFADRTVRITDFGAEPNRLATGAIQQAIDHVSGRGGGTVIIPAGTWLTGRIHLKSHVNLHVDAGAEVTFSGRIEDYRPAVFTRNEGVEVMSLGALIYADGQEHIAVTGRGTLIGPPMDCPIRRQVMNSSVIERFIDANTPVPDRIYEGYDGGPIFLPMFISPTRCRNVLIEGVTLRRTAFWNIVPVYCDGVIIRGVTVHSVGIPRGDGIDIESSRNVLIEYSTLDCGDDCFTMKAGRGDDGLRVGRPTENVVVRYCLAQKGHGGITLGSETAGWIRNLYVHDCVFDGTGVGIRFKTRRPRGGGGENVFVERIRMDLSGTAIKADMLGSRTYVGELADRLPARPLNRLTPCYRHVSIRDVTVHTTGRFVQIIGIPESPFTGLTVENAEVRARRLMDLRDARQVTFRNVHVHSDESVISLLDARQVLFERVDFDVPGAPEVRVSGEQARDIRFTDCRPVGLNHWSVPLPSVPPSP